MSPGALPKPLFPIFFPGSRSSPDALAWHAKLREAWELVHLTLHPPPGTFIPSFSMALDTICTPVISQLPVCSPEVQKST